MAKRFIVDTNIVTKALRSLIPTSGIEFLKGVLSIETNLSVVSKIELLG
ncbi:MAG: hypothetical protein ACK4NY_08840 [Spirosomataceae bacterium]